MPRHSAWSQQEQVQLETAFHEAGHAVLAKLTGTHVMGTIDARQQSSGGAFDCKFIPTLHQERDKLLGRTIDANEENAIICAAGAAAQTRFMIKNGIGLDSTGKFTDDAERYVFYGAAADASIVQACLGKQQWFRVLAVAENILNEAPVWQAVQSLADEVIRWGSYMPEPEVEKFLNSTFLKLDLPLTRALV